MIGGRRNPVMCDCGKEMTPMKGRIETIVALDRVWQWFKCFNRKGESGCGNTKIVEATEEIKVKL